MAMMAMSSKSTVESWILQYQAFPEQLSARLGTPVLQGLGLIWEPLANRCKFSARVILRGKVCLECPCSSRSAAGVGIRGRLSTIDCRRTIHHGHEG